MKKVLQFLWGLGWPVLLGLVILLLVFPKWFKNTVGDPISDFFQWGDTSVSSSPDTIYVKGPERVVDHWYERIVYRESSPDTVTVVHYETAPATVAFVGAEIQPGGRVRVEVLVDSTVSHVLEGELAPYGTTHVVVNPDSSLKFVTPRFGLAPGFTAGVNNYGPQVALETFFINDVPILETTVHLPNIVGSYRVINTPEEDREIMPGVGASMDIAPFHSPGRVDGGVLYSLAKRELRGYFGLSFLLYSIH